MPNNKIDGISRENKDKKLDLKKSRSIVLAALGETKKTPVPTANLDSAAAPKKSPKPVLPKKESRPKPVSAEKKKVFASMFKKSGGNISPERQAGPEKSIKNSGLKTLDGINFLHSELNADLTAPKSPLKPPRIKIKSFDEPTEGEKNLLRKKLNAKIADLKEDNIGFDQLVSYEKERQVEAAVLPDRTGGEKENADSKAPLAESRSSKPASVPVSSAQKGKDRRLGIEPDLDENGNPKYVHTKKIEDDQESREKYEKKVKKEIKNFRKYEKKKDKAEAEKARRRLQEEKEALARAREEEKERARKEKEVAEKKRREQQRQEADKQEKLRQKKRQERKDKIAQWKERAVNFKNRLIDASVNALWYGIYTILGFFVIYVLLFVLILKIRIDHPAAVYIANQLNFPVYLTDYGVVGYREYGALKQSLSEQYGELDKELLRTETAKKIVLNNLSQKYDIEISERRFNDQEFMDNLKLLLIQDEDVNIVGLTRIRKIEEKLKTGEELNRIISLADEQGPLNINEGNKGEESYYRELLLLEPGEISPVIFAPDGYYLFKCFSKSRTETALSYVFVKAKSLEEYLRAEIADFKIFSLIE